ncbi:hypothetical protein HMPREF1981_00876 [Bacteroides pyogenes F0041]|uniref:Uncharacterized protein n=1 Tax=Bacteroides pyogenes F0041 TaxID=1321819 RepID=U2E2G7_9BACE|nr:hypothetical protein HMPREF1981_00876 [Bacteroides pyogenes F0041]
MRYCEECLPASFNATLRKSCRANFPLNRRLSVAKVQLFANKKE